MAAPGVEARALFAEGVRAVLGGWAALQLAVAQGFGGPQGSEKAAWLSSALLDFFTQNADLEQEEVEDFLAEVMDNEFDTVVEDGSLQQVGGEQRGGGHGVRDTPAPLGRLDRGAAAAAAMMGGGVSCVSPPSLGDTPPPPCSPNWGGIKAPPPMGVWEEESCDYWRGERPLREPLAPLRAPWDPSDPSQYNPVPPPLAQPRPSWRPL
ncbi:pre-rRNA-processing protein TSR2 homolog isoform X2 [Pyrgilauda ruficollis]|uniref:pre-rRNA-processing protein TSR2 homolog isoform X2 n=1 Tax=Pyrgilauda ruficollis TaxID=221976 RepID=UPI001B880B70|nr:pre-rRNA-processing protein TSR2 homolog isoform X2 [Pyrgilauda ruficollis]